MKPGNNQKKKPGQSLTIGKSTVTANEMTGLLEQIREQFKGTYPTVIFTVMNENEILKQKIGGLEARIEMQKDNMQILRGKRKRKGRK
jgi:hypothetical protein